ncbi:NAD dependent epimerase dehydratase [Fusarium albosuccineum]|uniref:NAD dependent epimerase dehydratase n=1 Tax=Fusarium albosuccineum TaxID=1237068 RepID=A0A8H4PE35_9HYPO|nr:NAD dependent epimerase dehydratase [Fusarium albosuccineum]
MSTKPTLSLGSLVLVTGANGYIAAQVVKQLLERGYKVRGTVRDLERSQWVLTDVFPTYAKSGQLELVVLNTVDDKDQFRAAVRGVAGVIHIASPTNLDPDPQVTIPPTIALLLNLAKAAAAEPSVKEFVYTSTIGAATRLPPKPGFHFDGSNWNEESAAIALAPPPYNPDRALEVYIQSKIETEKALWKFVDEDKPGFTVNAVIVCTVFGPRLHKKQNGSTSAFLLGLYNGDAFAANLFANSSFVDVRDVALLHVASLLDPSIQGARIPAWGPGFNWNDVLAVFRKYQPDKKFIEDIEGLGDFQATADVAQAKKALKTWGGQDDFIGLEEGVIATLEGAPL